HVIFNLAPAEITGKLKGKQSFTADYLTGRRSIPVPRQRKSFSDFLYLKKINKFNIKDLDVKIPVSVLTVLAGVSGSGKSTLIQVLKKAFTDYKNGSADKKHNYKKITLPAAIEKVLEIDQKPIGRTPRSNPATYTKAMDHIRALFSQLPEAKVRGYNKGRFSFNVKGGRCENCRGGGSITLDMQLFSSVEVTCEICNGRRFNGNTLDVRYKNKNIFEILQLTVSEALEHFRNIPKLRQIFTTMENIGLGYLTLGQSSTTLSGGEAQRIKLASELSKHNNGRTLYLLDEPTTGLHFEDIKKLLSALHKLTARGNTIIVIEHNPEIIKNADHLIEMGPRGGAAGGKIIAAGTPEQVCLRQTPTGRELVTVFARQKQRNREKKIPRSMLSRKPDRTQKALKHRLTLQGCRQHNLKNINLQIPKYKLTVITGVSGSGKSSLAFDTIFTEGQFKYIASMSTYARRFLGRQERADSDAVKGIAPTIAVDQNTAARNPRSILATQTELYDSFRVLFTHIGRIHCPVCGKKLNRYSPHQLTGKIMHEHAGRNIICKTILYQADSNKRYMLENPHKLFSLINILKAKGYLRLKINGITYRLDNGQLSTDFKDKTGSIHRVELILDRFQVKPAHKNRIFENIEKAYSLGEGVAVVETDNRDYFYARHFACFADNYFFDEKLTTKHFSFNHHLGACPLCHGLGKVLTLAENIFIAHPQKPLL
ncbi:MAG TPA: excinuclease ABC subunit UvrA, partial [Spirochaetota bacterium]|nr:excinuclease ABC subunit UvrA [Spirochaetota bacterium]